jgi:hypothetical protein
MMLITYSNLRMALDVPLHPAGVDKVGTKISAHVRFKVAQFWIPLEPSRLKHNMATPEEVT